MIRVVKKRKNFPIAVLEELVFGVIHFSHFVQNMGGNGEHTLTLSGIARVAVSVGRRKLGYQFVFGFQVRF